MGRKAFMYCASSKEETAIVMAMQKETLNFLSARESTIKLLQDTLSYTEESATKMVDRVVRNLSDAWEKTPYQEGFPKK